MAVKQGKIFTVTSMKGGTGKTTTVLNLAGIFKQMGKKVLIVDMDFYGSAVAASLNLDGDRSIYNVVDDLTNNRFDYIDNYVLSYDADIDVLAAPKDPRIATKIGSKYLGIILTKASMKYDVLLVDTNYVIDENKLIILDHSDEIVYLMTNDPIDIKNMKSMISIYKDMDKKNHKIVLNEAIDHNRSYFNKYDIKNIMKDNVDYTIPSSFHIKSIDKFVLDGKIMTLDKTVQLKNKKAMKNFDLIAKALLREKKEKKK